MKEVALEETCKTLLEIYSFYADNKPLPDRLESKGIEVSSDQVLSPETTRVFEVD